LVLTNTIILLLLGIFLYITCSKKEVQNAQNDLDIKTHMELSLLLIIMILIIPYNLPHYIALILPALVFGLSLLLRVARMDVSALKIMYGIAIALNVLGPFRLMEFFWKPSPVHNTELALAFSMPFAGTFLMYAFIVVA